jgi:hypothetical protein
MWYFRLFLNNDVFSIQKCSFIDVKQTVRIINELKIMDIQIGLNSTNKDPDTYDSYRPYADYKSYMIKSSVLIWPQSPYSS